MTVTAENEGIFHKALGIRAGLPAWTCRRTQAMKHGRSIALRQRRMMVSGLEIFSMPVLRILRVLLAMRGEYLRMSILTPGTSRWHP